MRQRRTYFLLLILCGLMFSFSDVSRQLTPEDLKEDIKALRKGLEKYHPGLYWYTSKEQFDLAWDSLNASIDKPMTDEQFFKLLLPVVAKVKCAHTLFYPSKEIMSSGKRFPLDLNFANGKAYIITTDSSRQRGIPNGSELVSVNGKSLKEIVDLLLPNLEAQGGNLGWKYVILENDFQNYYHYVIEHAESFSIEYIDHNSKQKRFAEIDASDDSKLRAHWRNWYPETSGVPLSIKFTTDDVAIVTIKSLSKGRYKAYQQDFDETLAQFFKSIKDKGTKNLIIDVRGNEGGNNPEIVYAYIARDNDKNINASNDNIKPTGDAFKGNTIVLMNERSISSQEVFVSIFKNNTRGLTIGRSTPGSYNGLCGGNKRKIVLPNARFEIQIPLHASRWHYSRATNYKIGEGFPPDIQVDENIEDILLGKDSAMEAALDKMREGF
jgi:hypothetical protein